MTLVKYGYSFSEEELSKLGSEILDDADSQSSITVVTQEDHQEKVLDVPTTDN